MNFNKLFFAFFIFCTSSINAQSPEAFTAGQFTGLNWRSIGPALVSGRIADFAVNPKNPSEYYVAAASGGVWKTTNKGTNFQPIFDGQGSYSIGCVTIDPNNTSTVWVGSGENNNQRSVAYGDGVYKSEDAGKSWKNMGLKNSEHIGKIIVDPSNSNTIYVAAYGPVWKEGGDRGLYKSIDGGATWKLIKSVSQYTGCNDIAIDPSNPKIIYAAFHQRMRKVFTFIGGGPETALFKSMDGGDTWKKLEGGLPSGDLGRIGIGVSPVNNNIVYAVIEARDDKGGIYRSMDKGASWEKRSGTMTSGNYYQELDCDPHDANKIYITDTYYKVSYDGGKTTSNLGEINKHIDNHAIWVDPRDPKHLLVGCDGGIYETYDHAKTWEFKSNLPITQFYKVSTDNAFPFYNVHGGTQDNFSLMGPSRNTSNNGICNEHWQVTSTGDGFETQVDPTDPNIIYAQSQYGGLVRYDHESGEYLYIKPIEGEGEAAMRWNWDSPLLVSQHKPNRIYFGSNIIHRSNDQGNSWEKISGDLSRQLDRNKLEVMGRVWSVDAVAKNMSTDIYGQSTTIAESKFDENILWVGTDDGLIQYTNNGGKSWTKIDNIPGIPAQSYVHQIIASLHDKNTAYACFNHHRYGDFKPYVVKTTDAGKTWKSISGNLPERGSVYSIAEDHIDPNLLFVGTEFGCYFSNNGGTHWIALKSGLPTIAVRDIELQRRENDIVIATFGRSFYILDDYSMLRNLKKEDFSQDAKIFPIKDAWMYVERTHYGLRGKGHNGSNFYNVPNPKPGAVFTYHVKEDMVSRKEKRQEAEKASIEKNEKISYPPLDSLRAEDEEEEGYLFFSITDESANVIRNIKTSGGKGLKRFTWDLRAPLSSPVNQRYTPKEDELFSDAEMGHFVKPGKYSVSLNKFNNGVVTPISNTESFIVKLLPQGKLQTKNMAEQVAFLEEVDESNRQLSLMNIQLNQAEEAISGMKTAAFDLKATPKNILESISAVQKKINKTKLTLYGDNTRAKREFENAPTINDRLNNVAGTLINVTTAIPKSCRDNYAIALKQMSGVSSEINMIQSEVNRLKEEMIKMKAPYYPGR